MEIRFIDHSLFHKTLNQYYDNKNCDIEFKLYEGEWIGVYIVRPRDKDYYYNYALEEDEWDEQERAFRELEQIFFSDEKVEILRVEQWESLTDPYRIYIKPKERYG